MIPTNTGNETNIKLPFSFIFISILSFVLSQLLFLLNGDFVINGQFRMPVIWSIVHLFVLGWALMLVMGAMYQLVPVVFLTPIWSERFGFFQWGVMVVGLISFTMCLYLSPQNILIPGLVTVAGIILFILQMVLTLRQQKRANIFTLFVGSSLFFLLLTIVLGLFMVISLKFGTSSELYSGIFHSHLLVGLVGWFSLLIFGFSYKMVPMFSLSHGYPMKQAIYVYSFYLFGIITIILSFFIHIEALLIVGLGFLLIGFSIFMWHTSLILKKRLKKRLDRSFKFALLAILFGGIIHFIAFLAAIFGYLNSMIAPLLYLYLFSWIVFSIVGYLYKIVPFLWWTYKYSKKIGKKEVPALKDLIDEKYANPIFLLFIIAVVLVCLSFIVKTYSVFLIGQWTMLLATSLFGITIVNVVRK